MNERLLPPDPAIRAKQYVRSCLVNVRFTGHFKVERDVDAPTLTFPRNVVSWSINHYLHYDPFDTRAPIEIDLSFAVSDKLGRGAALDHAVIWIESVFYPGILDDALSVSIEYAREGDIYVPPGTIMPCPFPVD